MEDPTLSPKACEAWMVRGVIDATAPATESPAEARVRSGIVVEMYKSFDPGSMVEAMLACQCIALRFTLMGAIRAACAAAGDAKLLLRLQSSVAALNRTLLQVERRFDSIRTRAKAEAAPMPMPAPMPEPVKPPPPPPSPPPVPDPGSAPARTPSPACIEGAAALEMLKSLVFHDPSPAPARPPAPGVLPTGGPVPTRPGARPEETASAPH